MYFDNRPALATESKTLSMAGNLALHLLEDLTSLAGGGPVKTHTSPYFL